MTPIDELITAKNDLTLKDAYHILQRSKKGSFFSYYIRNLKISNVIEVHF